MNPIITLAIQELPNIIQLLRTQHELANPDLQPLTDEEVIAGLQQAINSSQAKDDMWLAAHPPKP